MPDLHVLHAYAYSIQEAEMNLSGRFLASRIFLMSGKDRKISSRESWSIFWLRVRAKVRQRRRQRRRVKRKWGEKALKAPPPSSMDARESGTERERYGFLFLFPLFINIVHCLGVD